VKLRAAAICAIGFGIVIFSLLVAAIAATVAIARPDTVRLDAELASHLAADYSADPHSAHIPSLRPDVIEAAREDNAAIERGLDQPGSADVVIVFRPGVPGVTSPLPPAEPTATPASSLPPDPVDTDATPGPTHACRLTSTVPDARHGAGHAAADAHGNAGRYGQQHADPTVTRTPTPAPTLPTLSRLPRHLSRPNTRRTIVPTFPGRDAQGRQHRMLSRRR
jgi:hypothetical protein